MTTSSKVLLLLSAGLLLAITFNVHALRKVRGAENAVVPITYVHRIRTIHVRPITDAKPVQPPQFIEFKDYTGLRTWEKPQEPLKVLVKEVDERLVITTSVLLVFIAGVGFICGYGARKTN
jgi:hypothetical protein